MIVITLSKTPPALRGDLTRWCQEIQTGIYVGEVSARIRDKLWERVLDNVGNGEATLVYNTNTEQGYAFRTTRKSRRVIDLDGMFFVKYVVNESTVVHGFSKAAKCHKSEIAERIRGSHEQLNLEKFVAVDIETSGLDTAEDRILSIGAVGVDGREFYRLINQKTDIPDRITDLTGITRTLLDEKGVALIDALLELKNFIGNMPLVGYNFRFDMAFLERGFKQCGLEGLKNRKKDLMPVVKRKNKFLENYKLETVLEKYGIKIVHPHNAVSDARATKELAMKLIKIHDLVI